jgi:hypothetical protein
MVNTFKAMRSSESNTDGEKKNYVSGLKSSFDQILSIDIIFYILF